MRAGHAGLILSPNSSSRAIGGDTTLLKIETGGSFSVGNSMVFFNFS